MKFNPFLLITTFSAALGGLLFGFDSSVISGAVDAVALYFQLDDVALGFSVSSAVLGSAAGAGLAGSLSDKFGRKKMLLLTAVLFAVSSVGSSVAYSFPLFIVSRILCGLSIGAVSVLSPTYITEIAPAQIRGRLVSLNQLMIVIGILMAYFSNYLLADSGDSAWRYMLGTGAFPATLFFMAILFAPESPRWLLQRGRNAEAEKILFKIGGAAYVQEATADLQKNHTQNALGLGNIGELFKGKMFKVFIIGVALACLQQVTGINAIIYYAPTIFKSVGSENAFMNTVLVGVVNLAFTFVAIWLIDRLGRKPLMVYGAAGMALSLSVLVWAFFANKVEGMIVLLSILGYIASFAASLAPIMWVVVTEIFPNKIRGIAMAVCITLHWSCTFLVTQTFPWILNNIGGGVAFGIFAVLSVFTVVFVQLYVPETKGKSLEQIERELGVSEL